MLNHAYDGLLDMADALGIPPKALSLNGDLAIAFGARGTGGKGFKEAGAAHYETDYEVMNLTKMDGAGSLAHEWFHALDHYLARLAGVASKDFRTNERGDRVRITDEKRANNLLSNLRTSAKSPARPELIEAFREVVKAMTGKPKQVPINTEHAAKNLERYQQGLEYKLAGLRRYLTDTTYNRSKKAATPEQLNQWDALSAKLRVGDMGEKQYIGTNGPLDPGSPAFNGNRITAARESRSNIVAMNAIYKAVTGRSFNKTGYDSEGIGCSRKLRQFPFNRSRWPVPPSVLDAAN